jgi:predicted glycogen debranching enzyme
VPADATFAKSLTWAADQFLVRRGGERTIIAGYPWFTDWGRDTMITLPGLTLSTGRPDAARSILRTFARCANQGMLPNRFPDEGETPEYNTADATLWFFEAARAYRAHTDDLEFIRKELYDVLAGIVSWHEQGTRYGIRVDDDGLLLADEDGVQLTWMDAQVGDWVVTPRQGKAVEIQALWYNALRTMEEAKASFAKLFWNAEAGCLYDTVDGDSRSASIRPNQIFAVSLFHTMVSRERAVRIVEVVERHLLTPFGLRSLAPSDPQYRGRYEGGPQTRDTAYRQGTVWSWLMGPFVIAYLRVHGRSAESRVQVAGWLWTSQSFMDDEGTGQLPEVFDGDSPHRAGGCIAQAWSVAELLRICEEVSVPEPRTRTRLRASA